MPQPRRDRLELARVLLVHGDLPARLALETILRAGGYAVEVAASMSEALAKLDEGEYELVLSHLEAGSHEVLAYARVKEYRPATALITGSQPVGRTRDQVAIHTEDLPLLLGKIAELIGLRASRRYSRPLRVAG
jgi:CheY-like chemotaxis protein